MTEPNETIQKSGDPGPDPVVVYTYVLIALSFIGLTTYNFYFWFFWIPKMKENEENDGEHNDQELQKELSPTKKLMWTVFEHFK